MSPVDPTAEQRLAREDGPGAARLHAAGRAAGAPFGMLFAYPAPYRVGMSSLGFLTLLRTVSERPGWWVDRVFLPDAARGAQRHGRSRTGPERTLRGWVSGAAADRFHLVGLSVAHELDLGPAARLLAGLGLPPLRSEREALSGDFRARAGGRAVPGGAFPLVVAGGPLTAINPRPLGALADLVVVGEADEAMGVLLEAVENDALDALGPERGFWWPGSDAPLAAPQRVPPKRLPAFSDIWSPDAELRSMALVEVSRSCKRACAFCASSRLACGPLRLVAPEAVLARVPAGAPRVGLVGAAVSDHPALGEILDALLAAGKEVGVSSVRVDRLEPDLLERLVRGGLRTLTLGVDGASERVRRAVHKGVTAEALLRAAALAREAGLRRIKLYQIVGLPGEQEADWDEFADLVRALAETAPVSITLTPFVPKPGTPLAQAPQLPPKAVQARIRAIAPRLAGIARVRADSARWAWVEARLARGGLSEGEAVVAAERAGGRFSDYRRALEAAAPAGRGTAGP